MIENIALLITCMKQIANKYINYIEHEDKSLYENNKGTKRSITLHLS